MLDDPCLPAPVVLADTDPEKGPAVGIGSVYLVSDRRAIQDVAADLRNRVLGRPPSGPTAWSFPLPSVAGGKERDGRERAGRPRRTTGVNPPRLMFPIRPAPPLNYTPRFVSISLER